MSLDLPSGLPSKQLAPDASFLELLRSHELQPSWDFGPGDAQALKAPEATTILALRYADGVVMVGDRRATEGHTIAHRRMQKPDFSYVYSHNARFRPMVSAMMWGCAGGTHQTGAS